MTRAGAPSDGERGRETASPRPRRAWRVWLLSAGIASLAAGAYLAGVRDLPGGGGTPHLPWYAIAVLFCLAEIFVVHVHFRRDAFSFSLSEVPLVLGLVFSTPGDVILAQVVGSGVALALHRRQPPVKIGFNLTHLALEACVAFAVFHATAGGQPMGPWGWTGAFVAALAAAALADVAVWLAISISDDRWDLSLLTQGFLFGKVVVFTNTSLGVAAAVILWEHPGAAWLLVLPIATVVVAYRAYAHQRQKHQSLGLLYESGRALQRSVQLDATLRTLLEGARTMFRAEIAEVTFFETEDDRASRTRLGADGTFSQSVPDLDPTEGVWARVASEGRGVLLAAPILNERLREHFAERGIRDVVTAPIHAEDRVVGVLQVANRLGDVGTFDDEDLRLLETLSNNAAFALENARLVGRLEESLARLTEMNRLKDDFVATVSHELRTPLTIIQGFIKTLLRRDMEVTEEERRHFLEAADRGGDRLRELIEQLLIVARLESDTQSLQIGPVSIPELVIETLEGFDSRRNAHLFLTRVPDELPEIRSDRAKLAQILSNLVENAVKYSDPGTTIAVEAWREAGGVVLAVADEGNGIPEEHRERIFERFFQVDSSTTRQVGGTGLGLYIARRLARELGGKLWLERSTEHGSEFRVLIPDAPPVAVPSGIPAATAAR
jgi:signal transduction histidine kinase